MKKQNGVTLMTLVIYIIAMLLVLSILSILSQFFFSNTEVLAKNSDNMSEYNKFNMYFVEDVKNNTDAVVLNEGEKLENEIKGNEIVFKDGTTYTYKEADKGIYRNKVKICQNINKCEFAKKIVTNENINFEKQIVEVTMVIKSTSEFSPINEYVLKYW